MCWDPSGELLASVSEDSVRVWTVGSGSEGECVHELSCNGNKFHSCVFHPTYPSLLVIGCYQASYLYRCLVFINIWWSCCHASSGSSSNMQLWILLQSLELWNMSENKTMTLTAHEGLIAALAVSTETGYVASASHDKFVKLWK